MRKKMKTGCAFFALLVMMGILLMPMKAYAAPPLLVDEADVLTSSEEREILELLEEATDRLGVDVAIYTVESLNGRESLDVADDIYYYDKYGQGSDYSGALLLHCPAERDYAVTTCGSVRDEMTDKQIDKILDDMIDGMREGADTGDYTGAYKTYIEGIEDGMKTGLQNFLDYLGGNVVLAPVVGFIVSFLYTGSQKAKLKTVRRQASASQYVAGPPMLAINTDMFINRTVSKTRISKDDNSGSGGSGRSSSLHTHSSGTSFRGGSRKY